MKCKICGRQMRLDDKDIIIKDSHYDYYWICDNEPTSCIEQFRCGIPVIELWYNHCTQTGVEKQWEIRR